MLFIFLIPLVLLIIIFTLIFSCIILILLSCRLIYKTKKRKIPEVPESQLLVYSSVGTFNWFNRVINRAYPIFQPRDIIISVLNSIFLKLTEDVSNIQSITLTNFQLSPINPPILNQMSLHTSTSGDFIDFHIYFHPELVAAAKVITNFHIIRSITSTAVFKLHSIEGFIRISIPKNYGPIVIQPLNGTVVKCDVEAKALAIFGISTETISPIWDIVSQKFNQLLCKIQISLDFDIIPNQSSYKYGEKPKLIRTTVSIAK